MPYHADLSFEVVASISIKSEWRSENSSKATLNGMEWHSPVSVLLPQACAHSWKFGL